MFPWFGRNLSKAGRERYSCLIVSDWLYGAGGRTFPGYSKHVSYRFQNLQSRSIRQNRHLQAQFGQNWSRRGPYARPVSDSLSFDLSVPCPALTLVGPARGSNL
jgi:hypothetical protein